MFSDHLKTIDELPTNKLLLLAAGLVLVCQLVAMGIVAGGQVDKAQLRRATHASVQSAMASCVENRHGSALNDCARLASTTSDDTSDTGTTLSQVVQSSPQGFGLVRFSDR